MSLRRKLLLLGFGVSAAFLAWKAFVYYDRLRIVPEAMNVWWVRYAWEKSWGFGPGGSYTGIIVYDMPEAVKTELREKGLAWLNVLPPNTSPGAYDSVSDWRETPIPNTYRWTRPSGVSTLHKRPIHARLSEWMSEHFRLHGWIRPPFL